MTVPSTGGLECPNCGQKGRAEWEDAETKKRVASVSEGFHIETGRTSTPDERVVVCDTCDEIILVT